MGETMSLCRFDEGSRIEMTRHFLMSSADSTPIAIPLSELEEVVQSHLRHEESNSKKTEAVDDDGANHATTTTTTATSRDSCYYYASSPPLQILTRFDAHWLECRRPYRMLSTVFGIEEELDITPPDNNEQDNGGDAMEQSVPNTNPDVQIEVYHPSVVNQTSELFQFNNSYNHTNNVQKTTNSSSSSSNHHDHHHSSCSCQPPHRDWKLQDRSSSGTDLNPTSLASSPLSSATATAPLLMRWVDLRSWQQDNNNNNKEPFLNSPAAVTHFLRSLLGTSHEASLWLSPDETLPSPNVVALLLTLAPSHLLSFRVGDASPSYYLHSVAQLQDIPIDNVEWWRRRRSSTHDQQQQQHGRATLLVYRLLSPRDQLSIRHPKDPITFGTPKGCLWETYYYCDHADDKVDDDNEGDDDEKNENEADDERENSDDNDNGVEQESQADDDEESEVEEQYRLLAPPYVSCDECFPGVLDPLLTPQSLAILRREAMAIAHWTAWPEKQHYRSTSGDAAAAAANESNGSSVYPASWTVFPLCYCFPANDPSALKWIPQTCQLVPGTVELLQQHLGSKYLRTALFSRLDPETTLEPHVGWADLANHVLRLHIPLVVPPGGLCGTWVDGCVETHQEGRVICLDDGKLHRAFNYSQQPRIVLIVDLARPSMLPLGTATGGHSDELDKFIDQMGGSTS